MTTTTMDVTPTLDGGVLKEIKREGAPDTQPWKGDRVHVHYVGTLASDGSQFDSSRDRGARFSFTLGKGEVIKGWDLGVAAMNKGELAVLTIKAEYGYGPSGSPPKIPGDATLVFEVELLDYEGEDVTKAKDRGVMKRTREAGAGLDHPNEGAAVEVEVISGPKVGTVSFTLGEGMENDAMPVPTGLELAIGKMKKDEVAKVSLTPANGFGAAGNAVLGVAPGASLEYEVKLVSFERAKESWQLDGEEKLEQSKMLKDKGTAFFKQGKYELASKKYKKIVEFLEHEISLKDAKEEERKSVLQAGRLNLAMCHLKAREWIEARDICEKVLEENPDSDKAHFRRGEALMHLSDHEMARQSFAQALKLDPENKAAKGKMAACLQEIRKQKEREKKTFANMFDKFAQIDAKREEERKKGLKPVEIDDWAGKEKVKEGGNDLGDVIKVSGDVQMDLDLTKEMKRAEEMVDNE